MVEELSVAAALVHDVLERDAPAVVHRDPRERVQFGGEVFLALWARVQADDACGSVGTEASVRVAPDVTDNVSIESGSRVVDQLEPIRDAHAVDRVRQAVQNAALA